MIEIYLLEHLDAFARLGTLSAASEELHISQPALTRSMQKLEQELGVTLFVREKNRMMIKQNSTVFWLERPPHLLSREGRPLSGGKSDDEMREMYNKRCAAYECSSDARIICSGGEETIDSAAKRIMKMTGIPEI